MKKAKYVLVTLFFGLTLAAVGFDRASHATPMNPAVPAAGETAQGPASVPMQWIPEPTPRPACFKGTCLGPNPCSSCCAGHKCVIRNGCPETQLACS